MRVRVRLRLRLRGAVCAGAVALLLGGAVSAVPGAPVAYAADGGGRTPWSLAASAGDGKRPYFYVEGAPGAVLQDTVSVTNPDDEPLAVTLRGGPGGAGAWVAFARREVTVPPRTRAEVPFTVAVPSTAAPGDHPGTIAARDGGGRDRRVAVHLRVSGPALPALTVERVKVDVDGGRISYDLVNRGTTVLAPRVAVRARGVFGELLDRAPRKVPGVAPGRRVSLSEPWGGVPGFDVVSVEVAASAGGGVRGVGTASVRIVPWTAVAGVSGGLVGVVGGFFAVRGRLRRAGGGA
ncbi:hypothetical protein [Streptomyces sp. NPDC059063]|uniref:COG1470 family protein n=1 Tax=unclassified Streptomyces TaxID=2593676 RepID=UPI0036AA54F2